MDPHVGFLIRPVSRRVFIVASSLYLLVRIGLGLVSGGEDTLFYQRWAYGAAQHGLVNVYRTTDIDYPPLSAYLYYPIGEVYERHVDPERMREIYGTPAFVLLIKTPNILFDFMLAGLIYWLISRRGMWGDVREGAEWGRCGSLLYLFNPVVLWDSAYWGQLDGAHTMLTIASFAALVHGGAGRLGGMAASGGLLAAAGMTKVLVAPLAPLLALATTARNGVRGLLVAGASAIVVVALVLLPFAVAGRLDSVVDRVLFANTAMPYTSCNAHNLWMAYGAWQRSNVPVIGSLTLQDIGVLLVLGVCVPLLVRSWRWLRSDRMEASDYLANLFVLMAAVYCSFFYLTTNLHSNHLFIVVPLLLLVAGRGRAYARLAAGCTVAAFLNMAVHDLSLPYGLPGVLSSRSPVFDPFLVFDSLTAPGRHAGGTNLNYTWLQAVLIPFNVLLATVVCVATYVLAWRLRPTSS